MGFRSLKVLAWGMLSFVGLALLQTWPLPLHLSTHLTGLPGGDAGVYVWNTWVFRHELVDLGQWPFSTQTVLPLDGDTNLSLHNYTVFADLLSLPLQPFIGVVAAFNVVYIINVALTGLGMFLLARRFTERTAEAWIAGALFACSPFLVARGASHFSLAAAAPLPFFVYFLDRAWRGLRLRDALAAGVVVAWAAFSDPYYAIYCVMLAAVYVVGHVVVVAPHRTRPGTRHGRALVDLAIATLVCVVVGVNVLAGGAVDLGGFRITMRTLYTPVLLLTCLVALRLMLTLRPTVAWRPLPTWPRLATFGAVSAFAAAILLFPELYAIAVLAAEGKLSTAPVLWRSSAPGLDLAAFFIPNPNHPLMPDRIHAWLAKQPGGFDENVASVSFVGLAVIAAAWKWASFRPSRLWTAITLGFASLAVGPFLEVAGRPTFIPTPWTVLRYFPVIGEARMPQRFAVVVMMGFTMIVAFALVALGRRFPAFRRRILATTAVLLAIELLPAPRPLFSAAVPDVYRIIAADPRPLRVLELPFGIRDGLSSLGNFSAASQFYQTHHGKQLLGGYLSRVPRDTKEYYRGLPVMRALIVYSEYRTPTRMQIERAQRAVDAFLANSNLGYVVLDSARVTPALRTFAVETLRLTKISESGTIELYATERGVNEDGRQASQAAAP
jgi:hypothetical protein